jgi:hypothetical protein
MMASGNHAVAAQLHNGLVCAREIRFLLVASLCCGRDVSPAVMRDLVTTRKHGPAIALTSIAGVYCTIATMPAATGKA